MQAKPNTHARLALAAVTLLLALPLAGCVENVNDLKEAITGATSDDKIDTSALGAPTGDPQSGLPPASVTNVTKAAKPPVARIAVYAEGGALAFKAGFAADETMVPTVFEGGSTVTFSGSGSEAVDARASIVNTTWTIAPLSAPKETASGGHGDHGGHAHTIVGLPGDDEGAHGGHEGHGAAAGGAHEMTGVSVQHTFPEEGGLFLVTLTVEDDLGGKDTQAVKVGVNPAKVVKSVTFKGTVQAGHAYTLPDPVATDSSAHVFNVSDTVDDLPAKAVSAVLRLTATGQTGVDLDLAVHDPAGEEAGAAETPSSSSEAVSLSDLAPGDWQAVVRANLGAAADYELVVEVTYQPSHPDVVATFGEGGDGHGGHAH